MTTLTEKIARRLNAAGWTCHGGAHEPGKFGVCVECTRECMNLAPVAIAAMRAHLTDEAVVEAGEKALKRAIWGDDYNGPDRDDDWTDETRAALAAALDQEDQK